MTQASKKATRKEIDEARLQMEEARMLLSFSDLLKGLGGVVARVFSPLASFVSDTRLKNRALKELEAAYQSKESRLEKAAEAEDEMGRSGLSKRIEVIWNEVRAAYDEAKQKIDEVYGGKDSLERKRAKYAGICEDFRLRAEKLWTEES